MKSMLATKVETFIQEIFSLPDVVLQDFKQQLQRHDLPKDYFLHRNGSICQNLWIIESGLVRHFWVDENEKEKNIWFSAENTITTDTTSFFNQATSSENIQLLENSIVYSISYDQLIDLQNKHHSFCLWFIKMLEKHYFHQIEQRIDELQFFDATERYSMFVENNPTLIQRISLGNLASFLNVSPETLSRIRGKK